MSLSNFDFDRYYRAEPRYMGCYAKDALPKYILPLRFYIINLDDNKGPGTHWTCIMNFDYNCLYFDSYGILPPLEVVKFMKGSKKECYYNYMQLQGLDSDVCGYWCMYMIDELLKGKSFLDTLYKFASRDYAKNDAFVRKHFAKVEKLHPGIEEVEGGAIVPLLGLMWSYIKSRKPRENFPPKVRSFLTKYGDVEIQNIMVCRTPIESALATAMNWLSLGMFKQKLKELNYDNAFHLFLIVQLANGMSVRIEKNHVVSVESVHRALPRNTETRPVTFTGSLSLNVLLVNGVAYRGPDFFKYDSVTANCQDFVLSILKGNKLESDEAFIKQKAEELVPTYLQKLNRYITDTASQFDVAVNGNGVSACQAKC